MELAFKEDWPQVQERYEAWWQGEIVDRAVIQIFAPQEPFKPERLSDYKAEPGELEEEELFDWFTDPEQVIPRLERQVSATYWGGDAFPVIFPVSVRLVTILAAYLGCPYRVFPGGNTGWADPVIEDWDRRPSLSFDTDNEWWRITQRLLEGAAKRAKGHYYVGIPDLNGPGEIVARLRGTEELAVDVIDRPQVVKEVVSTVNEAWLWYWEACHGVIHQWIGGYIHWIRIWSESPSTDLQCDFSIMISPEMFEEFFLPSIEKQTEWVGRTIYHLDGPGAVRHVDALLALPKLDGIQWIPGAGAPPVSEWIPLLQRIQSAGKLLQMYCEAWEVERLLAELRPEGLLLSTTCNSVEEAESLVRNVGRWSASKHW